MATALKDEGNARFKEGKYNEAVELFTQALGATGRTPTQSTAHL